MLDKDIDQVLRRQRPGEASFLIDLDFAEEDVSPLGPTGELTDPDAPFGPADHSDVLAGDDAAELLLDVLPDLFAGALRIHQPFPLIAQSRALILHLLRPDKYCPSGD